MSTVGLRRRPHYEEVLNAAHKDQATQHGILGVGLQNFATRAINSPLFQRVQTGIEEKMRHDQRQLLEEQGHQHDVQAMAVDQEVSQHDLNWVVQNLQRPTPAPVPPPQQPQEARIDYLRVAAEMDALAQRRAVTMAHQQVAAQATQHMTVATPQTPAQLMIRDHHASAPTLTQAAPMTGVSAVARRTGQSVHAVHAAQNASGAAVPVPGLLSITDTPRASGQSRTRTSGQTRTRNTPYGANSSLAVPPGGFSARAAAPAPTAPATTPAPTPVAPTP